MKRFFRHGLLLLTTDCFFPPLTVIPSLETAFSRHKLLFSTFNWYSFAKKNFSCHRLLFSPINCYFFLLFLSWTVFISAIKCYFSHELLFFAFFFPTDLFFPTVYLMVVAQLSVLLLSLQLPVSNNYLYSCYACYIKAVYKAQFERIYENLKHL